MRIVITIALAAAYLKRRDRDPQSTEDFGHFDQDELSEDEEEEDDPSHFDLAKMYQRYALKRCLNQMNKALKEDLVEWICKGYVKNFEPVQFLADGQLMQLSWQVELTIIIPSNLFYGKLQIEILPTSEIKSTTWWGWMNTSLCPIHLIASVDSIHPEFERNATNHRRWFMVIMRRHYFLQQQQEGVMDLHHTMRASEVPPYAQATVLAGLLEQYENLVCSDPHQILLSFIFILNFIPIVPQFQAHALASGS